MQVPGAREVAVEFFTMSKSYNMAGWRIGFMVGNKDLVNALARIKSYHDYGTFTPLQVAAIASIGAMILGTCAAFALHRHRSRLQTAHEVLITMPLVLPEILMGMSLLLLFVSLGTQLSLVTVTIAHITFCISYVTLVVQSRLQDFDFQIVDAARDLGATRIQAFRKVVLPLIAPGILAGGLLAFTLSIDDFVVTFFVKGPGADTLPVVIYSMIKKSREFPVINALSTLLLMVTFLAVWGSQRLTAEKA